MPTIYPATAYLAGFDQDTPLTASTAQTYYTAGYRFCLRYLSIGAERSQDLSTAELNIILTTGLALMPVQHVDAYGWSPNQQLGQTHGTSAASDAKTLGLPTGLCVWLDLEGVAAGTSASNIIAYCQAWYAAVAAAGYVPGIYVGPQSGLSGTQLSDLSFHHYWQSASKDLPTPTRGFQLFQGLVEDDAYDPDYTAVDNYGGTAIWVANQQPTYPTLAASSHATASDPVKCLQRALNAKCSAGLTIDGLFGAQTTAAVRSAQAKLRLPVTGIADPATWAAIAS